MKLGGRSRHLPPIGHQIESLRSISSKVLPVKLLSTSPPSP